MKNIRAILVTLVVMLSLLTLASCGEDDGVVLRVYNWAEYMDPEVIEMFEEETGIQIFEQTFDTCENMYNQIKNTNGYSYDVVFPSDYMVKRMISEEMLAELNFDNIPNYQYIDEKYDKMSYDKKRLYSVPYIGGTICLAYNPEIVDESEVSSWNVLWNPKYEDQIFMMDSERDSIAVALKTLGYSINTKDLNELEQAKQKLLEQKPLVLKYTSDNVKELMANEEGALAVMWSCDTTFVTQQNDKIKFTIPEEGTNIFWDAACILKDAKYKTEAEMFLNFLCRPEIAKMNAEYLESTTPNKEAYEMLDDTMKNNTVIYPDAEMVAKSEVFDDLSDVTSVYTEIWNEVTAN